MTERIITIQSFQCKGFDGRLEESIGAVVLLKKGDGVNISDFLEVTCPRIEGKICYDVRENTCSQPCFIYSQD
jgi:hypothetical protein